ncbi:polyphosphate kinase 2 [Ancylobacter amanitiformis]|uniref:ADP/GDP-polyphosphate phosphotransferase n=1 Tax=Ancylobacter amanitiformis TaxID=217069 RepID=A0ABU0LRU1_9HYPH|nr:polyphosphate kinase 2 [Ancylobacter amanitiformis]MDQ0511432.1 polyphosphate kinase 2 [Ancylobacter amanitiformis]
MSDDTGPRRRPAGKRAGKPATAEAAPASASAPSVLSALSAREPSVESGLADERMEAAQQAELSVAAELAGSRSSGEGLEALIAGAAPDDAARLRKSLGMPRKSGSPSTTSDELADDWRLGGYPFKYKMLRRDYEREKFVLQSELLKLQSWVKEARQRVIILFEGRDAAGKGGAIKRFMEHLNPRGARVVALEKPSEVERGQWYFQRYVQHLPTTGEIVLFDRSWYNRAGVEKVMGFCTDDEYREFLRQAPEFERNITRSGIHLFKFWFSVSRDEQRRRFKEREVHPLKHWKLSPVDLASLDKWDDYTRAKEAMFFHTDTADSPWTVIKSDDKKRARLNAMRYVLHSLPYTNKDATRIGPVDTLLVGRANSIHERGEHRSSAE